VQGFRTGISGTSFQFRDFSSKGAESILLDKSMFFSSKIYDFVVNAVV
jgi:hypothetical protein